MQKSHYLCGNTALKNYPNYTSRLHCNQQSGFWTSPETKYHNLDSISTLLTVQRLPTRHYVLAWFSRNGRVVQGLQTLQTH